MAQGVFFFGRWDRQVRMTIRLTVALSGLFCSAACGGSVEGSESVVVYAAASLMEAFEGVEQAYEKKYPSRDVRLNFAGSHVLRTQIEQGAEADLVATADLGHLDSLHSSGLVSPPAAFAVNRLTVVVAEDGLDHIQSLDDLLKLDRIVLGSPQVPVGRYAQAMLESCGSDLAAGIAERVVSFEDNARLVRAKVELGEAQAAVVYQSDAQSGRGIRSISIPERCRVSPVYGIARLLESESEGVEDFLDLLDSEVGQEILHGQGFGSAP